MGYHSLDALLDVQVIVLPELYELQKSWPDTEGAGRHGHPGTLHYRMFFGSVSDPIRNDEVGGYLDERNMLELADKFSSIAFKLHEHVLKLQQHRLQLSIDACMGNRIEDDTCIHG
jgi:hypothetical protein